MKKIAISLICALVVSMTCVSCLPEGEETELTSTVALLSFSINDLKTQHTITLENGKDSTYTTVMATSKLKFTIDHANGLVYNSDSIAYGTNVTKVLASIGADGYVSYYKDGEKVGYSEEDSIDFTYPVKFVITSYDEQYSREYLISVLKHQVDPKVTHWQKIEGATFPKIFTEQKAVVKGEQLFVFGTDKSGRGYTTSTAVNDGVQWVTTEWNGLSHKADCASVILLGETFYMLGEGILYQSLDAINWEMAPTGNKFSSLLAVTADDVVWGVSNDTLVSSLDMATWGNDGQLVSDALGRCAGAFSEPLRTNQYINRTLFVVTSTLPGDTCAQVWSKLSTESEWTQVKPVGTNIYGCPNLENLAVISYRGKMYAFGGKSMGDRKLPLEPFSACYESRDNGVTWRERDEAFSIQQFSGYKGTFSTVVTNDQYVWIMWSKSGEVWKGTWYGND